MTSNSTQQLSGFFESWSAVTKNRPLRDRLDVFFNCLRDVLPRQGVSSRLSHKVGENINTGELGHLFNELEQPLFSAKRAGFFCDPWSVASLKRDEVRNSAVLAWWLNPHGSHGLNDALLSRLLQAVESKKDFELPKKVDKLCRVRVESCPDGDRASRVDIEIDDPYFFLIIEVKIDAPESEDQLKRYCDIATLRSGKRPWAILFLTPQGRDSRYLNQDLECAKMGDHVVPITWKQVSSMLNDVSKKHSADFRGQNFPELALVGLLARSFCKHILHF